RIQDVTCIHHRHHAANPQTSNLRLPRDLDKMAAERMGRELRVGRKRRLFRTAAACDQPCIRAPEHIAERNSFRNTFSLYEDATILHCEIFRLVSKKR